MRHITTGLLLLLSFLPLAAQDGAAESRPEAKASAKFFAPPEGYFLRSAFDLSQAVQKAWPLTALGAMQKDAEVAAFLELFAKRTKAREAEFQKMEKLAREAGVKPGIEDRVAALVRNQSAHPQRMQLYVYGPDKSYEGPSAFVAMEFDAGALAELRKVLDEMVGLLEGEESFKKPETPDTLGGVAAPGLVVLQDGDPELYVSWSFVGNHIYLALGRAGLLARARQVESQDFAPVMPLGQAPGAPVLGLELDFTVLGRTLKEINGNQDKEVFEVIETLGLDGADKLSWQLSLEGRSVRETGFVSFPKGPAGILKALVPPSDADVPAPPPLPVAKSMMAIDGAIDMKEMVRFVLDTMKKQGAKIPESGIPGLDPEQAAKVFSGSYSFAMSRPNLLSPTPKMAFGFGVADTEGVTKLLEFAQKAGEGLRFEKSEYKDVEITELIIPNSSVSMAPTYALVNGSLYVADSPRTLKRLIKSIKAGKLDRGEIEGELPTSLPLADIGARMSLRYDAKTIFKLIYGQLGSVLPMLLRRVQDGGGKAPMIEFSELPSAATLSQYLSPGAGGAGWGPGGLYFSTASPLGNPLLSALASVGAPLYAWGMGMSYDQQIAEMERAVLGKRVTKLRDALGTWRSSFGSGTAWPGTLGELFVRGLIEDESVLRVPSDATPASLEYENEDGEFESFRSSYKFLPKSKLKMPAEWAENGPPGMGEFRFVMMGGGVQHIAKPWPSKEGEKTTPLIILYEAGQNAHGGRMVLLSDGAVLHVPEPSFKAVIGQK